MGGIVAAAGGALRAWGAGHLVKTDRLAVAGPYAFLRHPPDAGTLLAVLGLGAAAAGDASGRSAERFRANDEGGALLAIAAAWPLLALRGAAA